MSKPKPGEQFKSLRNSVYGMGRSGGGAFDHEELAAFFLGIWIQCSSTNVAAARYVSEDEILEVEFKDGSLYQFHVNEQKAEDFAKSPTKGGILWDWRRAGIEGFKIG